MSVENAEFKRAFASLAKYCSSTERSPHQLLRKMKQWSVEESFHESLLDKLRNENFLNEERFARAFAHDKLEFNQWGKNKIKFELRNHWLDEDTIFLGLDDIDESRYGEIALSLIKKKEKGLKKEITEIQKNNKVLSYMVQKGFEIELVKSLLSKLKY